MSTATMSRTFASERQTAFLATLLRERVHTYDPEVPRLLTKQAASLMIDELVHAPRVQAVCDHDPVTEVGMYLQDGAVYKVQRSRESGNLYAKRLVVAEPKPYFDYAAGAIRRLSPDDKMTLEQGIEYGIKYGVCCVCGALLTDEKSIAAGIGPVCAKRF
jgi:hypothetical protein